MKSKTSFKKILIYIVLSAAVLVVFIASYFRTLDNYELETLDLRFRLRGAMPATDKVVIIEIGEDTIEKLGRFPFDRSYHALLVKALSEFGAKAIIFDIFFSEPASSDRELEEAMRKAGSVYMPFVFDIDTKKTDVVSADGWIAKCLENFAILAKGTGHINLIPDMDGKFRRVPLYIRYGNAFYPYISFLASCDYIGISEKDVRILPGRFLLLGKRGRIPLDENSNMIINFSGRWGAAYRHYSYVDVLQSYFAHLSGEKPTIQLNAFKDKLCVIGLTAAGTGDLHPSPFEPLYPGVGIHAEVFNSIINNRFITRASQETNLLILVILGLLISIVTLRARPIKGLFVLVSSVILFALLALYLFNRYGIWIDLFCPVIAVIYIYLFFTFYKYIAEWKKRLIIENELGIARKIQQSFLPKTVPSIEGLNVNVSMFTARQVGGDLYDFIEFGPERLGVMIGDVSGKGIPASLFMAMTVSGFKSFALDGRSCAKALYNLNLKLSKESSSNLFVTIFYAIFDVKTRTIVYANGGHLPVLHLDKEGKTKFLDVEEGAPLGLMEGNYSSGQVNFDSQDIFVFYTDGVTEAMNSKHEMYGKERLVSVVEKNRRFSSKTILDAIAKDVRQFEPKRSQHDDITVIVIKIS